MDVRKKYERRTKYYLLIFLVIQYSQKMFIDDFINMTNAYMLRILTLIHSLIIVFVLLTPFFGSNYFLVLHLLVVPFIVFHWIVNQSICSLTLTEKIMRKKLFGDSDIDNCVSCKIIQPIYDFKSNSKYQSTTIYFIVTSLWLITVARLYFKVKNGELTKISDLKN